MSWNYRVIRTPPLPEHVGDEPVLDIHEVFYADDNKTIKGYAQGASSPFGTSMKELADDVEAMTKALSRPVLTQEELDEYFPEKPEEGPKE